MTTVWRSVAWVALVTAVALGQADAQGTFKLESKALAGDQDPLLCRCCHEIDVCSGQPDAVKAVPDSLTEKATWIGLSLGEATAYVVIEPARLHVLADTDGDGDFSDEKPVAGVRVSNRAAQFRSVPIANPEPGGPALKITLYVDILNDQVLFGYHATATYYTGEVTLGDETYAVAVADDTCNGRPNDVITLGARSDYFAIDLDCDGQFEEDGEISGLPGLLKVGDTHYRIAVKPDGSTISFTKEQPALGTLRVPADSIALELQSAAGIFHLEPGTGPWQLPVGDYQVVNVRLATTDEEGAVWRMEAQCRDLAPFEIRKGETTALAVGPPLILKPDVKRQGGLVSIGLTVIGQHGEEYSPWAKRNNKVTEAPGIRILGRDGAELVADSFGYG